MHVVFCRPRVSQDQEDGFAWEADVLDAMGVEPRWIEMELVTDGRLEDALDGLPEGAGATLLRSWMLREAEYAALFDALAERGYLLVNDSAAYARTHYLPNVFEAIEPWTTSTRWTDSEDPSDAWAVAQELGAGPFLLKDHVKSAKDDWSCGWVPAGSDRATFVRICSRFVAHRGDRFERGVVVRSLLPLVPLSTTHGEEPCFDEVRLFFWKGALVAAAPYFDVDRGDDPVPDFGFLADRIDSDFFTVDIARLAAGGWVVLDVGDGAVSTLPSLLDTRALYECILDTEGGYS